METENKKHELVAWSRGWADNNRGVLLEDGRLFV